MEKPNNDTTTGDVVNGKVNESGSNGSMQQNATSQPTAKKPSKLKQLWDKTGLDVPTVLTMFKGSLPPTIAIAMYQSDAVAGTYQTLGYLVAITSVIGMCIFPRGMFIQNMLLNVLAVCIGAAVSLLALYCAVQARLHTTPAGAPPTGYNSSASAVLAIWLIFNTYWTNALRAVLPQLQFPVIIFSILSYVSLTNGVQFPTMPAVLTFMQRLLEAFLTGFGLATAVHFAVFSISSRTVAFKKMSGYLNAMGGLLRTQAAYLQTMEHFDPEAALRQRHEETDRENSKKHHPAKEVVVKPLLLTPESAKMKELLEKIYELYTKMPADVNFAKREFAIGKLSAKEMGDLWKVMKKLMVPITGLNTVIDIFQRRADKLGWSNEHPTETDAKIRTQQIGNLHALMQTLHEPFQTMSSSINAAFQHVLITLELEKPPKKAQDEENAGDSPAPGTPRFAESFKKQLDDFFESKKRSLTEWCAAHSIELPSDYFDSNSIHPEINHLAEQHASESDQKQLFLALYIEYLLWRAGDSTLELVLHVDKIKADGALKRNRLMLPGAKALRKWLKAMFNREEFHDEDTFNADLDQAGNGSLYLGQSYSKRKDPEHLPPANTLEKIGDMIRMIPQALRSDASAFGFRVAAATMSVGIVCYLEASQAWFLQNRILWAMIMIPLSMSRTAGQSTWSFALRILGTFVAMTASYVIWYIVDGKAPGVIVFLWLWIFSCFYILAKMPKLIIVGVLSMITSILIIGYELQTDVIGKAASEASGQPAYPTYLLAPYRLATVCGGIFVAFVWTIFPYPVSESTELRKDLGASLYLLANLQSIVNETVKSRLQQIEGDEDTKGTRAYHLRRAHNQVAAKLIALLTTLKQNSAFSKFQLRVGGRFPHAEYEGLIDRLQRVLQYASLIAYASHTFSTTSAASTWSHDLRALLGGANSASHRLTSLLTLLSSSLSHARPLPPFLEVPRHERYASRLDALDRQILGVQHMAEPEYSAFAVMAICAQCVNEDVGGIMGHVKTLVGEMDFSFQTVPGKAAYGETSDDSSFDEVGGK